MAKRLTKSQVEYVAKLAHIGLTEKEIKEFKDQLSAILDFVSKLQEVDTDQIKPLSQTTGLENVFRQDVVKPSFNQKQALANAPDQYNGYFKTKSIFK
ncbi:Asp-tRNA(Asn)/Glu-tRNA(Gln) amidotransferase subunit GatC [Candidatus Parcubacteria bacterium]|nr:Asp-tRNA(Asn)/Glu-tRNA(Gln) amidotransferase subunit GatC [Patescibacteria group bacterium]MBU4466745.1 Asp-tRNA(Asn)/Glu-tRNA(Gln) amidotransferase subunit GatC [Patescibacteria group bacterium]MCG2688694.1 Asp-tRNA(Asn)/Glu-tRNA(Gln) amidotransferase subunit GatC [Candidatus Parcubacteria bacterium]